jgi:hypothetical protein
MFVFIVAKSTVFSFTEVTCFYPSITAVPSNDCFNLLLQKQVSRIKLL